MISLLVKWWEYLAPPVGLSTRDLVSLDATSQVAMLTSGVERLAESAHCCHSLPLQSNGATELLTRPGGPGFNFRSIPTDRVFSWYNITRLST